MSPSSVSSLRRDVTPGSTSLDDVFVGRGHNREFWEQVAALVARADLDEYLEGHALEASALLRACDRLAEAAFTERDSIARFQVQKALYVLYEDSLGPVAGGAGKNQFNPFLITLRNKIERRWERFELDRIGLLPTEVPTDPDAFSEYFVSTCWAHPMIGHRLFEYLSDEASRGDLINFFLNDGAVIIRFCDLVVMSMVGVDEDVRPELATNFWDEMGRGEFQDRHAQLYRELLDYSGANLPSEELSIEHFIGRLDWSGLTGYNLYLFLCLHRRNQFRALGALGAAEMTDPPQYGRVLAGCRRVGLDDEAKIAYYAGHHETDVTHGADWLKNVLLPLVRKYPDKRHEIVTGALMRMNVTLDYYDNLLTALREGSLAGS